MKSNKYPKQQLKKKQPKKNTKKYKRSKKYKEYLRRQRAKASRIKARREKHRRVYFKKKTSKGFFMLFAIYLIKYVKLRKYLQNEISLKKHHNSRFGIVDMIISLIGAIALGLPRVYDICKYQEDRVLARALRIDNKFPSLFNDISFFSQICLNNNDKRASTSKYKNII